MESKSIILWKCTKKVKFGQKIDKMTKKAKIHQKCKIFKILVNFVYFVDFLTFLDNLPKMRKSNLFSISDELVYPKAPILAPKIEFWSIFEIIPKMTSKMQYFHYKKLTSLNFFWFFVFWTTIQGQCSFRALFSKNVQKMGKMTKKWTKWPKRQKSIKNAKF